ncbi:hypothetical protein AMELA_G00218560 [Ameiurus melas]|uniref:Interleukin-12 subunit alpha n=1 Tax=Ameiurus melas TaxID=219545 RepID=A0A7J6A218_AMEME|nr:hypothetical protein AMELA_G00218560 [Ameiurus melas]
MAIKHRGHFTSSYYCEVSQLHTISYYCSNLTLMNIMYGSAVYVLIFALVSRAVVANPVRATTSAIIDHTQCTTRARDLLTALKRVLDKVSNKAIDKVIKTEPEKMRSNTLFHGFNCTDLEVVVNSNTQTASVCQPRQDTKCSDQKSSPFNETQCLQNIANDLGYHESMLTEYMRTLDNKANSESVKELQSITDSIHNLTRTCKLPNPESSKNKWSSTNSFEDRKDLCKQLKGFQVRTITINRALGYVCAGEYKK